MKKTMFMLGMMGGSLMTYVMMNKTTQKKACKLINSVLDEADNAINGN